MPGPLIQELEEKAAAAGHKFLRGHWALLRRATGSQRFTVHFARVFVLSDRTDPTLRRPALPAFPWEFRINCTRFKLQVNMVP